MTQLAHNLSIRRTAIHGCDPKVTIYWIGDAAHLEESSDHNPDSGGFVHAIDVMYPVGPMATAVVNWCLADPADLQYVIHNRTIYDRADGFKPKAYTGKDPHTNHVHISGKHGSARENEHTGTGYDLAAEAMSPTGSPCDMEDDMTPEDIANAVTNSDPFKDLAARVEAMANLLPTFRLGTVQGQPVKFTEAITAIPTTAADVDVDVDDLAGAILGKITLVQKPDPA